MVHVLTIGAGLLLILAVSVFGPVFNVDRVLPAAAVVATVYAGVHRDAFGALLATFAFGLLAGLLNAGGRGLLLLSLLPVLGCTLFLRTRTPLIQLWFLGGWTVAASLLADIAFVVMGLLFFPRVQLWPVLFSASPLIALATGGLALLYGLLLGRIEPLLEQRQARSALYFIVFPVVRSE